jgi:hypothetical protein
MSQQLLHRVAIWVPTALRPGVSAAPHVRQQLSRHGALLLMPVAWQLAHTALLAALVGMPEEPNLLPIDGELFLLRPAPACERTGTCTRNSASATSSARTSACTHLRLALASLRSLDHLLLEIPDGLAHCARPHDAFDLAHQEA